MKYINYNIYLRQHYIILYYIIYYIRIITNKLINVILYIFVGIVDIDFEMLLCENTCFTIINIANRMV